MKRHGAVVEVIDANLQGLHSLLDEPHGPQDTWSRRARRHLKRHLASLHTRHLYVNPDAYRRAVADINRILSFAGSENGILVGLADYADGQWTPSSSTDLQAAARNPERNPFFNYYQMDLWPRIAAVNPDWVGISINFLSQALCAFALIGLIRKRAAYINIVIGGGLVTSWLQQGKIPGGFQSMVDRMVSGPGEKALMEIMNMQGPRHAFMPDYSSLQGPYLSPGFIMPYSAAEGCWWRRCRFCPERAERRPYRPLPRSQVITQLKQLTRRWRPAMIHLLDNALSPALLKGLAAQPPGAPWYGFTRMGPPLDDARLCRQLADAGCAMLKLGLESGDQRVLDALGKGVTLEMAARVLDNLRQAGISTYVYLLFGTPAEDEAAARRTAEFVMTHRHAIGFLNLAIFNLPIHGPDADDLDLKDFYPGDLALYKDFEHPRNWGRAVVRRFIDQHFKKNPLIQPILLRNPPVFTSNHAVFIKP